MIEPNEKQKQETGARLQLLKEKLQTGDLSAAVASQVLNLLGQLQQNNFPQARGIIGTLSAKHWAECKDWINSIKVIATVKQQTKK